MLGMGRQVQQALTNAEAEQLAKEYGVKGVPVLSFIQSVQFPWSFPYNLMHLIFENLVPNLIQLWTNDFKDLGTADDPFVIRPNIWQEVGEATVSSSPTIPYSFCSRLLRAHRSTLRRLHFTTGKRVDRGELPKTSKADSLGQRTRAVEREYGGSLRSQH